MHGQGKQRDELAPVPVPAVVAHEEGLVSYGVGEALSLCCTILPCDLHQTIIDILGIIHGPEVIAIAER